MCEFSDRLEREYQVRRILNALSNIKTVIACLEAQDGWREQEEIKHLEIHQRALENRLGEMRCDKA